MLRKGKKTLDREIINLALEELEFDEMPKCPCHLTGTAPKVSITRCLLRCKIKCKKFKEWRYVIDSCRNDICSLDSPCAVCIEEIEASKILYNVIHAHQKEGYVEYTRRKYAKRDH